MSIKKCLVFLSIALATSIMVTAIINNEVIRVGRKHIAAMDSFAGSQAAIVPGAYVSPDGRLCDMLADRVSTAVDLYRAGRVKKILMTGDHGKASYDEVNGMRKFAEEMGVPTGDIFMDHAGFSTYESMYRARDVFEVDSAVIVTQDFHLPRAVYIARELGIDAVGVSADRHVYAGAEVYEYREIPARIKAFLQVKAGAKPTFLGPAIPVSGDGRATHDKP